MYRPSYTRKDDPAWSFDHIDRNPFSILVSPDPKEPPLATHLPLLLDRARGSHGTLIGHVARGNPQWRRIDGERTHLAIFPGPHAYVTPLWYTTNDVPTWNYTAVHAYGVPTRIDDPRMVEAAVSQLVKAFERGPADWSLDSVPREELDRMLRAVVAFEMPVSRMEGVAKLNQNRSMEDQQGARRGLAASEDPLARQVADLMADEQRRTDS